MTKCNIQIARTAVVLWMWNVSQNSVLVLERCSGLQSLPHHHHDFTSFSMTMKFAMENWIIHNNHESYCNRNICQNNCNITIWPYRAALLSTSVSLSLVRRPLQSHIREWFTSDIARAVIESDTSVIVLIWSHEVVWGVFTHQFLPERQKE